MGGCPVLGPGRRNWSPPPEELRYIYTCTPSLTHKGESTGSFLVEVVLDPLLHSVLVIKDPAESSRADRVPLAVMLRSSWHYVPYQARGISRNCSSDVTVYPLANLYCEGVGSWRRTTTITTSPWGRKRTLPYTLACTVKSRPRTASNLTTKRGKGRERCLFLPELGCLATYVDYVPYVSLSRLGGDIHPTTLF
jgi:hypothetical protein